MKWLLNSSVARSLLGSFIAILFPLTLISLGITYINMNVTKQEVITSYENSFQLLTKQMDESLRKFEILCNGLTVNGNLNALNQSPANSNILLDYVTLLEKLKFYSTINEIDNNVTIYMLNKKRSFSSDYGVDYIKNPYNVIEVNKNENSFGKWFFRVTPENKLDVLSYMQAYPYSRASTGIIVTIDINISNIKKLLESLQFQGSGTTFLLGLNGYTLSSKDSGLIDIKLFEHTIINAGDNIGHFIYKQNKKNYWIIFNKSKNTGLILGMYFPEKQIMKRVSQLKNWIIAIAGISLGLALLFAYIAYHNLLLPIHKLTNAMKQVRKGNLKIRIPKNENRELEFMFTQFNDMVIQIDSLVNEVYMENLNRQQVQLKLLQSQINPHFLYNCLNFIYLMSMGENREGAAKMALYLGKYFRFATKSNKDMVTIREEMENIDAYIQIQKMRYPGKINYNMEITEEIMGINIPRLIIQPIIENSIVHGIEVKVSIGIINVFAVQENGFVLITVEDDGKGITCEEMRGINEGLLEMNKEESGCGLSNSHWRLKLKFGDQAGIHIENRQPKGTRVVFTIPYTKEDSYVQPINC